MFVGNLQQRIIRSPNKSKAGPYPLAKPATVTVTRRGVVRRAGSASTCRAPA